MRLHTTLFAIALTLTAIAAPLQDKDKDDEVKGAKEPKSSRWRISWGVDDQAAKIAWPTKVTPIFDLVSLKRPTVLPMNGKPDEKYRLQRYAPTEQTLFKIRGRVISVAAEHDGDYRLIVADDYGHTVCCVMPDPALAPKRTSVSKHIDEARAVVKKKFNPTYECRPVHVPVEVIGFGYFGRYNAEENPSPEGFQLHPIVAVKFL